MSEKTLPVPSTEASLATVSGLLGWIPTWIVGRRHYDAVPPAGVTLVCERQPDNPSDTEAIAVYAPGGGQTGHLPRCDAAYLAPLLDRGVVRLETRLSGPDDPDNRTPIRLEVWPAEQAADLAGRHADTAEAVWHHQLLGLWQNRARYAHTALDAFRSEVRAHFHAGGLWPETQLLYRLLKGTVADGAAAAEQVRLEQMRREAEAAERSRAAQLAECRAAIACEACGPLLPFGHLSVLPLRAVRPAAARPIASAVRQGTAAISCATESDDLCKLRVKVERGQCVFAVKGEELDTTLVRVRVLHDSVFAPGLVPDQLFYVVKANGESPNRRKPVFMADAVMPEPALPALPGEATGFAVFRGAECLEIALFTQPGSAAAALPLLRARTWHLKPASPAPSAAEAFASVRPLFTDAALKPAPPYIDFSDCPGLSGEAFILGGSLVYLRVKVKEQACGHSSLFGLGLSGKLDLLEGAGEDQTLFVEAGAVEGERPVPDIAYAGEVGRPEQRS